MTDGSALAISGNVDPGDTGTNMPLGYGQQNFAGYVTGTPSGFLTRFLDITQAIRRAVAHTNAGAVYRVPAITKDGVLPGNTGLLRNYGYLKKGVRYTGVLYAFTPVKEASQTILSQWAVDAQGFTGDTPGDLMPQIQNAPPWRRAAARGDSRQSFRSGIYRGARY